MHLQVFRFAAVYLEVWELEVAVIQQELDRIKVALFGLFDHGPDDEIPICVDVVVVDNEEAAWLHFNVVHEVAGTGVYGNRLDLFARSCPLEAFNNGVSRLGT